MFVSAVLPPPLIPREDVAVRVKVPFPTSTWP
jgi:hypothetical protein